MSEYFFALLVLMAGVLVFYLMYERYFRVIPKPESDLYVEALRNLLDGRQETAFTQLRQVVAEDSGNLDAYLRLGKILRDNKKPDRALQVHKDLTLRGGLTANQKADILEQLFADYMDLNDLDMAEAALKELVTLRSRDRWSYIKLLELQKKGQKWDDAYDTAVMLLKIEGNKSKKPLASFKFHMGEELYKKREYHKARVLYKEALGFDPSYVAAYLAIGDSYFEEKRYEDAVNFWNKLITAVPNQGHQVIERLKKSLYTLGRYGEINQICEDILKHDPRNLEARLCLAEFHEKKGETDVAEEILAGVVEDYPQDIHAVANLIRIYQDRGEIKKIAELVRGIESKRHKAQSQGQRKSIDTSLIGI